MMQNNIIIRMYKGIYNVLGNVRFWISIDKPHHILYWMWDDIKYWVIKDKYKRYS